MPDTPEDVWPLGRHEEPRRKLNEERRIDYNDSLRQPQHPDTASQQTTKSNIQFGDHHSYLVQQRRKKWTDVDIKPYKLERTDTRNVEARSLTSGGIFGENRLSEETYKCLNSSPAAPRQRWVIPEYEDILNQKRAQESNYRHANDTVYETDPHVQEVIVANSSVDKQALEDDYKRSMQKQNKEMVLAKRMLVSDSVLGHCQAATDSRNMRGCLETAGGHALELFYGLHREPVRQLSLDPPPDLYYQPATYVTDKSAPNPYSFVDEAYNFYASHNPLDPNLNTEASHVLGHTLHLDSFMRTRLNDIQPWSRCGLSILGSGSMSVPPTGGENGLAKWHFSSENKGKSPDEITSLELSDLIGDRVPCVGANIRLDRKHTAVALGVECPSDADHKHNLFQLQTAYREELDRQSLEKSGKVVETTDAQLKCSSKPHRELNDGPCGRASDAELKGHADSSRRELYLVTHNLNCSQENVYLSSGHSSLNDSGCVGPSSVAERSHVTDTASEDKMYGRGGYGIFGVPMTDAQKIQAEKYMADLKKQIEEKQAVENKKRELERLEEEREQKILNEQRVQMQKEYEEEQRRIKEKALEAKLKNEEIIRAAEERKQESDRKDREVEKEIEDKQEEREVGLKERPKEEETRSTAKSPLIPTLRDKRGKYPENVAMVNSSPKTTIATADLASPSVSESCCTDVCTKQGSTQCTNTEEILTQLARMRAYLLSEHKRLQALLDTEDSNKGLRGEMAKHPTISTIIIFPLFAFLFWFFLHMTAPYGD